MPSLYSRRPLSGTCESWHSNLEPWVQETCALASRPTAVSCVGGARWGKDVEEYMRRGVTEVWLGGDTGERPGADYLHTPHIRHSGMHTIHCVPYHHPSPLTAAPAARNQTHTQRSHNNRSHPSVTALQPVWNRQPPKPLSQLVAAAVAFDTKGPLQPTASSHSCKEDKFSLPFHFVDNTFCVCGVCLVMCPPLLSVQPRTRPCWKWLIGRIRLQLLLIAFHWYTLLFDVLQFVDFLGGAFTAFCLWGSYQLGLCFDQNPSLVVAAVIFPIAFCVSAAYSRREHSLQMMAMFKGSCLAVVTQHGTWAHYIARDPDMQEGFSPEEFFNYTVQYVDNIQVTLPHAQFPFGWMLDRFVRCQGRMVLQGSTAALPHTHTHTHYTALSHREGGQAAVRGKLWLWLYGCFNSNDIGHHTHTHTQHTHIHYGGM